MTKAEQRQAIIAAFKSQGIEAIHGKGGFFLKGQRFVSFSKARKMTGIDVPGSLSRNSYEREAHISPLAFIAKSGW